MFDDNDIVSSIEKYVNEKSEIASEINKKYTSQELLDYIVYKGEMMSIYFHNNLIEGINAFVNNNVYYRELIKRDDCFNVILNEYISICLKNATADNQLYNFLLEILLAQDDVLCQLSEGQLDELNRIIASKEKDKTDDYLFERDIFFQMRNNDCFNFNYLSSKNNRTLNAPYTPNGTEVQYATQFSGSDLSQTEISEIISEEDEHYTNTTRVSNPTKKYNCHSYAWFSQNTSDNNYWIQYPYTYINDQSYVIGDGSVNEILCYISVLCTYENGNFYYSGDPFISHSAIITHVGSAFQHDNASTYNELDVISKWGQGSVLCHSATNCYYSNIIATEINNDIYYQVPYGFAIYKPRTNNTYSLNSSTNFTKGFTANGNGTIVNKYEMYELNANTGYYEFSVSSDKQLDVRMYDEHMQLVNINQTITGTYNNTFVKYLGYGRYYLRVAYQNTSQSGYISTTFASHNHSFSYFQHTSSNHQKMCANCGYSVYENHSFIYNNGHDVCNYCGYVRTHQHSYNSQYLWLNYTQHDSFCVCGSLCTEYHVVSQGSIPPGQQYATCLICGGPASMGIIPITSHNYPYTINGSYILPNGVVVLANRDMEAFFGGSLWFTNTNNKIIRNNSFILFILKKDEYDCSMMVY